MSEIIKNSYTRIAPKAPEIVDDLYRRLFARAPETRRLFPRTMSNQRGKFAATLELCVMEEADPKQLGSLLARLGSRHEDRGITVADYHVFLDCLIEALAEAMGTEWTNAHESAWRSALEDIGARMRGASERR